MLNALRKRMQDDEGFTLIELMVVVLIIGILIAIAIPTFLGLRERAQNRSNQSDLRNGLTAAKAWYTDFERYDGFTVAVAEDIEPPINWVSGAGPAAGQVRIYLPGGTNVQNITLVGLSESGDFFCIADQATGATARTVRGVGNFTTLATCDTAPDW